MADEKETKYELGAQSVADVVLGGYYVFTPPKDAGGYLDRKAWYGQKQLREFNDAMTDGQVIKINSKSVTIKNVTEGDWNYGREYKMPKDARATLDLTEMMREKVKSFKPVEVKPVTRASKKVSSVLEKVAGKVIIYGGFPVRYPTAVRHLDEVARSTGEKNWMAIRDAGLVGLSQSKQPDLPDDVQPLTYEEFKTVINLPSGEKVPPAIWEKWITMHPKEERGRFKEGSSVEGAVKGMAKEPPMVFREGSPAFTPAIVGRQVDYVVMGPFNEGVIARRTGVVKEFLDHLTILMENGDKVGSVHASVVGEPPLLVGRPRAESAMSVSVNPVVEASKSVSLRGRAEAARGPHKAEVPGSSPGPATTTARMAEYKKEVSEVKPEVTKPEITRSAGLAAGVGGVLGGIVGGGYSGATKELDNVVQKAAKMLSKAFGRDVEIRFNSDRHSGGAWLKDDLPGFKGNVQVGLSAAILPKVPKGMTRSEWHRDIAKRVGWGKEFQAEVDRAPLAVVVETLMDDSVVHSPGVLNSGNPGSRYASHEHKSLSEGLKFLLKHIDAAKVNLYKGKQVEVKREGKKSVSTAGPVALQSIESSRSALSQSSDERQSNLVTIGPDDPGVERWKRDPGSMDVRGIDTPRRVRGKRPVRKSRRAGKMDAGIREVRG